jgi:7,8-dihydropterin-6-yl-methyl-4-(beta-D-ribofuranosyl)aminobenzene 5'-phosphate synthase
MPPTAVLLMACIIAGAEQAQPAKGAPPIDTARVLILSTMLSDDFTGEWGFAALVEANGKKLLFDTGARPETVLRNAKELGVDLSGVTEVVLSHWHDDHTGGLVTLRRELMKHNRAALSRAHVGRGFFWKRREKGEVSTSQADLRSQYQALGGSFVEHAEPAMLLPGVWVTGEVPRRTPEQNFPAGIEVQRPDGRWTVDDVPDDLSLVIDSVKGLIVVTGCGHAGIVNTIEAARARIRDAPVSAVVGGLHLYTADDARLDWTAAELKRLRVSHLIGAHCTGIEAVMHLRQGMKLDRSTAVVGAVGASFDLRTGIDPRRLAH